MFLLTLFFYRNITVLVQYSDGVCDHSQVMVTEDTSCGCTCQSLRCPGFAHVNNDTCTCVCDEVHVRKTVDCGPQKILSPHSCDCECIDIDTKCLWPLHWSGSDCSCHLHMTTDLAFGLALFIIVGFSMLLCHINILYRRKIANLEVSKTKRFFLKMMHCTVAKICPLAIGL